MVSRLPLELADVDRVVARLLRAHPRAAVTGVRPDGSLAPAPRALRLAPHRLLHGHPTLRTHRALLGRSPLELVTPSHHDRVRAAWDEVLHARVAEAEVELLDGGPASLHLVDARPRHGVLLAVIADERTDRGLEEMVAAHEELRTREQLLHRLTETLPSGVVQIDRDGRIVHKNDRTALLVGHATATTLVDQLGGCRGDDAALVLATIDEVLTLGRDADIEITVDVPGRSTPRVCHVALRALTTDADRVTGAICSISDVTSASTLRKELTVRATVDSLTGCHNRASIMATLHSAMSAQDGPDDADGRHHAHSQQHRGLAVIFVDLDRFKSVNDRFGHAAGDRVLAAAADRMRAAGRSDDVVGRVGGDEFLVVCADVCSPAGALLRAQRIADSLRQPVEHDGVLIATSASVGVAWSDRRDSSPDALVAAADGAMYRSKRTRDGQAVIA